MFLTYARDIACICIGDGFCCLDFFAYVTYKAHDFVAYVMHKAYKCEKN